MCSDCKSGYTLAYDSFDCVDVNQCTTGMTVLVIALTFLYWILIMILLFVLTFYFGTQVSSGYFNGAIYFYSILDILLGSKWYITDGLYYTVAIISSFTKLLPQFLGRFCIVKGLDAIDQQFIHYTHVLCILFMLMGVVIAARYFNKLAFYVNRRIACVTFLFLILSYTSVPSTSLQLLRGIQYNNNDGVYVYLSPHLKYFTHRHAAYATVALLCGLTMVVILPIFLIIQPFLRKTPGIEKFKSLMNHFQGGYKEKYQCFAPYYLFCRLVIMLIAYFGNSDHDNMVYYMQTACVVIAITHISLQPYKKHVLNVLDAAILLTMLLVVNVDNSDFSKSATAGLIYTLLLIPLILLCGKGFKELLKLLQMKVHTSDATINPRTIKRYIHT